MTKLNNLILGGPCAVFGEVKVSFTNSIVVYAKDPKDASLIQKFDGRFVRPKNSTTANDIGKHFIIVLCPVLCQRGYRVDAGKRSLTSVFCNEHAYADIFRFPDLLHASLA